MIEGLAVDTVMRALGVLTAHSVTAVTFAPDEELAEQNQARLDLQFGGRWTWRPPLGSRGSS